jgi:diguanylate cyclase (GGDEF)-like protein/PAS domain S-box-containing protein
MADRALIPFDAETASSHFPLDEEDLRAFFDLSLDLFCVAGIDGYFQHLNPAWERTLGYSIDELYAAPFWDFIHPDDVEESISEAQRVAGGAETRQFVDRYRTADGDYRWLSWTATPLVGQGRIIAVARDVTEKRLRDQALEASDRKFRALVQSAPGGILIVDRTGSIQLANRLVEDMFGYTEDDLLGETVELLVPDAQKTAHKQLRSEYSEQPRHRPMGAIHGMFARHRDGHEFPVAIGLAPIPGDEGLVAAAITDMTKQFLFEEELRLANEELQNHIADLQEMGREAELTSEMAEMLQASQTSDEAHQVVEMFARRLFVWGSGAVGLINDSRNHVEHVATWGSSIAGHDVFDPGDCWALRRGKAHTADHDDGLTCAHLASTSSARATCVPLLAQGSPIGVLTMVCKPGGYDRWNRIQRLATTFGDHLALALANLRLRARLQTQSIRDPLTGLFNRRYMEESIEREFARAKRHDTPLSVIMVDIDHFKQFNDSHGHRAGDAALVAAGSLLQRMIRAEDIPCRYGGEEFALILPDATADQAALRAEEIRRALAELALEHTGESLGYVTLSAGIADFPSHGVSAEEIIHAADRALYRAKHNGRNRVELAMPGEGARPGHRSMRTPAPVPPEDPCVVD